jgi:ElaB/YqjD/DUF883 family membrane-anchored ribosome-binding protein
LGKSISEAIETLENANGSKTKEFKDMLEKDFNDVRKALDDLKPHLDEIKSKVKKEASEAKQQVEEKVKEHPWYALAIVAFVGIFIGWLLGHSRRD